MSSINPRARSREDRAGDPLDGMVNLFDLGIVLALGFMIAALAALDLNLGHISSGEGNPVVVPPGSTAEDVEIPPGSEIIGQGREYGTVYQLDDGSLVLVTPQGEQPLPGTGDTGTIDPSTGTDPNTQVPPAGSTGQGTFPGQPNPQGQIDPANPNANPTPNTGSSPPATTTPGSTPSGGSSLRSTS